MKISVSKYGFILTLLIIYFTSKILWDRLIPTALELVSMGLLVYGAFCFFRIKRIKGTIGRIFFLYVTLCSYIVANSIFQNNSQQFVRALYEYCFYILMFFGMSYYIEKSNILSCLKAVNVWGIIIAALSWYEYLSKAYILPNNFITTIYNAYGFRATVFTRSYLSHAMVLGFFSIVAIYLYYETRMKKYIVACFFCAVSVLTTSSRGPLVALTLSILIFYIMNMLRKGSKPNKKFIVFLSILFIVLIGLLFLNSTFVTGNEAIDYFLFRTRQTINWSGDPGNAGRINTWLWSFEYFKSNILFGIGPSHTGSWGSGSIGVTESGYLKYLCELGLIGFALIMILIISIIRYGKKQYSCINKNDKLLMIFFFSLITLVLVNNISVQSTEEIQINFIWALGMGGVLSRKRQ